MAPPDIIDRFMNPRDASGLLEVVATAAGRRLADLVLKNARVVNVASHEVIEADVAVTCGRIAGIGPYTGHVNEDLRGAYVCPGLIDAHVHIESSMLDVAEFSRVVAARGTTTVVADPHEFANVLGVEGIRRVLRLAQNAPIDIRVMLSSCVPASPLESAGATLEADDLRPLLADPRVLGLAEVMNYPGVISGDTCVWNKLEAARGRIIDGHAPRLSGRDVAAYAAAGIQSDHECTTANEALDKLRAGLHVMIREGSQTRNLCTLLPAVTPESAGRFMFCTDDKDVRDLRREGHIDHMVRTAIELGMDPILAVKLATLNAAVYFGLRDIGAVLPGYRANLVVVDDLNAFLVRQVYRDGKLVARDGRCVAPPAPASEDGPSRQTVHVISPRLEELRITAPKGAPSCRVHVIHVLENRIDTERSVEALPVRNGQLPADPARDLAKMAVFERHAASGRVGLGFVKGFNLGSGAIASSVAHDAHNLIAAGVRDEDMLIAIDRARTLQGGLVVANEGRVIAETPLPIAGLVSDRPAEEVAASLERSAAAARTLGCTLAQPFMALAFLSLSVIGKLKLTDQGLIDVEQFKVIPLVAT